MLREIMAVPAEPENPEMNSDIEIDCEWLQGGVIENDGGG